MCSGVASLILIFMERVYFSTTDSVKMDSQWSKQEACFAHLTQCGSLSITTPVPLQAK